MYLIRDDVNRYLTEYKVVTCNFNANKDKAITFTSLKRASNVLVTVSKLVPEYVKLTIEKESR